ARADVAPEVVDMLTQHVDFLQKTGQLRVRDMMVAVREYLHADTHMAYHLWVLMFPIVWATLEKVQQVTLAKPIIALLSKEYHHRQASARPNVVQAMLDGIAVSQPQPKIPPELIKFLGKTYNAWQIAIPLLESHVVMFPNDTRCFDSLVELYKR
ncbi:transformation transcription domain-associated, partial [Haematococcus lacustris]